MKIKVTENGYWVSSDWLYLDAFEKVISKPISFDQFNKDFSIPYKYDREWKGNNSFSKSECLRCWLDNEKVMVEICVLTHDKDTRFIIHKVITEETESKQVIIDLLELEELYRDILVAFQAYLDDYVYEMEESEDE